MTPVSSSTSASSRKTGGDTPKPTPPPNKPGHKPSCAPFQRALHIADDGKWGPITDKAAGALIHSISDEFPYGVEYAQRIVGTERDGAWGPKSKARLRDTITAVQKALSHMGFKPGVADGVWGPKTEAAYKAARKACHI